VQRATAPVPCENKVTAVNESSCQIKRLDGVRSIQVEFDSPGAFEQFHPVCLTRGLVQAVDQETLTGHPAVASCLLSADILSRARLADCDQNR